MTYTVSTAPGHVNRFNKPSQNHGELHRRWIFLRANRRSNEGEACREVGTCSTRTRESEQSTIKMHGKGGHETGDRMTR